MPTAAKTHSQRQHSRRHADRAYDRGRRRADPALRKAKKTRSSIRWQRFREWFIRRHPLCCDPFGHHEEDGVTVATQQVHHIEPLTKRPTLACAESNCAAVCALCHAKTEARERRGQETKELFGG